jgi:SPP1 family predicted phage head-tail adaptor
MSWPSINPGELRHSCTIQQQTATTDASGATVTWSDFTTAFAKIVPAKGRAAIQSGQTTAQVPMEITIRWQPGILANMRIIGPNGTYLIESIDNIDERNVLLVLTCIALGANQ